MMNEYLNAIKKEADYYKSKDHIEAVKLMVDIKNRIDKVKDTYKK